MTDKSSQTAGSATQLKHSKLLSSLAKVRVLAATEADPLGPSLQQVLDELGSAGHWLAIAFFAIPFLQPIPVPGLSSISGTLISLIGLNIVLGKKAWLPKKLANKRIPNSQLNIILKAAEKIWLKIEKLTSPRFPKLIGQKPMQVIQIMLIWLLSFLLALPLPIPFSNLIPAIPIFLIALGHIEDDLILISIADVLAFIALGFFIVLGLGAQQLGHNFHLF